MSDSNSILMVYVTVSSEDEAEKIGRILIEEHLAACVNIIPGIKSIYRWEEKIVQDKEAVLIAKTVPSRFQNLSARIKEVHSYSCPCIVAYPSADGYPEYMKWVHEETK